MEYAMKALIIGGVAAGATAAARIRRLDEHAEITIVERGPYVSFANCGLPYHISGAIEKRSKLLVQTPEGFMSRYRVQVMLNTEAIAVNRNSKQVTVVTKTAEGSTEQALAYDVLLLAQGGTPVFPNIEGIDAPHVFKLWTIPDMDKILKHIKEQSPRNAVVIGGGFIGLETAEAFVERGLTVTIVEALDHVMPQLDAVYGRHVEDQFKERGAAVYTNAVVKKITDTAVILGNGTAIPADLVLVSAGVKPNTELAQKAGLEIGKTGGLAVDEFLRTSDPWIWAAGDMIEIESKISNAKVRIPLAGPANRQGRIAATNAVLAWHSGKSMPESMSMLTPMSYKGALGTSVIKIFDTTLASTGLSFTQAKRAGLPVREVSLIKGNHAGYYPGAEDILLTLVYNEKNGRLLGAEAFGKQGVEKRIDAVAVALHAGLTVYDLAEIDFAYAPPYSSANDPLNMAAFMAVNNLSGYSPVISMDEIETSLKNPDAVLWLDVRNYGEYAKGHIKNSLHIPVDELRDRIDEIPRDKPIYCISVGGFEGHLAVRMLKQHGFKHVKNISGGWSHLKFMRGLSIE